MFIIQWLYLLMASIVLNALGFIVVPLALPFSQDSFSVSDGRRIRVLPDWAWLWSNDFDGSLGDKHGNWTGVFGLPPEHLISQFWWLAVRNPANNRRRIPLFQADLKGATIKFLGDFHVADKPGQGGWQFVTLTQADGKKKYGFYLVLEITDERAFVIRLGFKVEPEDTATPEDQPKGYTMKINPWKSI